LYWLRQSYADKHRGVSILLTVRLLSAFLFLIMGTAAASQIEQCRLDFDSKNYENAFNSCQKVEASGADLASAQYVIGTLFYMGYGRPMDYKEAFKWLLQSALNGHYRSQGFLGYMYEKGQGIPIDQTKAVYWYEKAANKNYVFAIVNLANMYVTGRGVEKSVEKALDLLIRAAELGDSESEYRYANSFYVGKTIGSRKINKDLKQAFYWYLRAAKNRYADAQFVISIMYFNGEGITKDPIKSYAWNLVGVYSGSKLAVERSAFLQEQLSTTQIEKATAFAKKNLLIYTAGFRETKIEY
jgi:TPR repeat protein